MTKLYLIVLLCVLGISTVEAKQLSDSIMMKKTYVNYQLYQYGKEMNATKSKFVMKHNPNAFAWYQESRNTRGFATFLCVLGSAGIVNSMVSSALSSEVYLGTAVIGSVLIGISIPIYGSSTKKMSVAVNVFNRGLQPPTSYQKTELDFSATSNGIGLNYRF